MNQKLRYSQWLELQTTMLETLDNMDAWLADNPPTPGMIGGRVQDHTEVAKNWLFDMRVVFETELDMIVHNALLD